MSSEASPLATAPALFILIPTCFALHFSDRQSVLLIVLLSFLVSAGLLAFAVAGPFDSSLLLVSVIVLFFAICCALVSVYRVHRKVNVASVFLGTVTVHGVREWGTKRVALADAENGHRYLIEFKKNADVVDGMVMRIRARVSPFSPPNGERDFNAERYWKSRGAVATLRAWKTVVTAQNEGLYPLRKWIKRGAENLPKRLRGYILASFLGVRDPELEKEHRVAGTVHLLAISGFHVGLVFALVWLVTKSMPGKFYIISFIVWFYVVLAGASVSAVRAALMLQVALWGRIIGRPSSALNTVCVAGLAMLLWNPWIFWDVGWRLSVVAVLTLISIGKHFKGIYSRAFLGSLGVWLATAPIIAWNFDAVPLAGIITNIFALPFFGVMLPLGIAFSIPTFLGFSWGWNVALLPEAIFVLWEVISYFCVRLIPWQVTYSHVLGIVSLWGLIGLMCFASSFSRIQATMIATFLTALAFLVELPSF